MKIYAIKDRLIDYFMQPFVGPDDKSVLASVARLVNQGEVTSDIAQAPHQFEVWTLGIVQEDGTLTPERQYLADCNSLIRGNIRKGEQSPEVKRLLALKWAAEGRLINIRAQTDTPPVALYREERKAAENRLQRRIRQLEAALEAAKDSH